jgi:hypothetical protein
MLGQYLFFTGAVTTRQLLDAIAWQRRQRPLVGRIAAGWGILSEEAIREVLVAQRPGERFCRAAVRCGCMSPFHRLAILGKQRSLHEPFGSYFLRRGILRPAQLEALVDAARKHNLANPR